MPPGFPLATTVQRYFYGWRDSGLWQTINPYLLMTLRVAQGREACVLLPRRWVVERTVAGPGRCRRRAKGRRAKNWERSIESATARATIARIRMLTHRIARLATH